MSSSSASARSRGWTPIVAGAAVTPEGALPAIISRATRRFEPRRDLPGFLGSGYAWLPDSRHLLNWDSLRNTAVLWDAQSPEVRVVPGVPGPGELRLTADGRTLVVNRTELEGDVWLLTLK